LPSEPYAFECGHSIHLCFYNSCRNGEHDYSKHESRCQEPKRLGQDHAGDPASLGAYGHTQTGVSAARR
jgi:hypothetical protein